MSPKRQPARVFSGSSVSRLRASSRGTEDTDLSFGLVGQRLVSVPIHDRRLNGHLEKAWKKSAEARIPALKAFRAIKASCWWRLVGSREGLLLAARLVGLDADVYESLLTRWTDGIYSSYSPFIYAANGSVAPGRLPNSIIFGGGGRPLGPMLPFSGCESIMTSLFPRDKNLNGMLGMARHLGYLQMCGVLKPEDVARFSGCDDETIWKELQRLMESHSSTTQAEDIAHLLNRVGYSSHQQGNIVRQIARLILQARRRVAAEEAKKNAQKYMKNRQQGGPSDAGDGVEESSGKSGGHKFFKRKGLKLNESQAHRSQDPSGQLGRFSAVGNIRKLKELAGSKEGSHGDVQDIAATVVPSKVRIFLKKLGALSDRAADDKTLKVSNLVKALERRLTELAESQPDAVQALIRELGVLADALGGTDLEGIEGCPEALARLLKATEALPDDVRVLLQQLGILPAVTTAGDAAGLNDRLGVLHDLALAMREPGSDAYNLLREKILSLGGISPGSLPLSTPFRATAAGEGWAVVAGDVGAAVSDKDTPIFHAVPRYPLEGQDGDTPLQHSAMPLASLKLEKDSLSTESGSVKHRPGEGTQHPYELNAGFVSSPIEGLVRKRHRARGREAFQSENRAVDTPESGLSTVGSLWTNVKKDGETTLPGGWVSGRQSTSNLPRSMESSLSTFSPNECSPFVEVDGQSNNEPHSPSSRGGVGRRGSAYLFDLDADDLSSPDIAASTKDPRASITAGVSALIFPGSGRRSSKGATTSRVTSEITDSKESEDPWELSSIFNNDKNDLALFLVTFPDEERHVQLRREAHRILDDINTDDPILGEYALRMSLRRKDLIAGNFSQEEGDSVDIDSEEEMRALQCKVNIDDLVKRFKEEAIKEYADIWNRILELRKKVKEQELFLENSKKDVYHLQHPPDGEDCDAYALKLTTEVNQLAKKYKLDPHQLCEVDTVKKDREAAIRGFLEGFARTRGRREGVSVGCQCTPQDLGYVDGEVQQLYKQMEDVQYHARSLMTAIKLVIVSMGNVLSFHSALELESTCKRCFCIFEEPRTLWPCGHSFCLHCLPQMIHKGGELICDECGTLCLVGYTPNSAVEIVAGYQVVWTNSTDDNISDRALSSVASGISTLTGTDSSRSVCGNAAKRRTVEKVLVALLNDFISAQGPPPAKAQSPSSGKKSISQSLSLLLPLPPAVRVVRSNPLCESQCV
uniref:RING-type domain-containing protein n=1 Tax=Trypanosoma congolense (strain IL3000) TaxID=1068625 RepID=G0URJ1_TRYCI|nr:conserved hypothetical protein [Trypanosoma congolense IL3000]